MRIKKAKYSFVNKLESCAIMVVLILAAMLGMVVTMFLLIAAIGG